MSSKLYFDATLDNGEERVVPAANSYQQYSCRDPKCTTIHIVSFDDEGEPICETSFTREQLTALLRLQ